MPGPPGCRHRRARDTGLSSVGFLTVWRGGCLAAKLVRSTVCYHCLGGCSAFVLCARRSRQAWGVDAGAGCRFYPWAPPCPGVPRRACSGLSCPGVPSLHLPVRHSMRSVRSTGSFWLPIGSATCDRCVCVHSCSRGVRALPPSGSVWRAHYAWYTTVLDVAMALASFPTCSFGSGTSHSGFTRFNPVELRRGAVEPLNRG